MREGTAVSLAHTVDKAQAPDSPRPLGQQMTLDAAGHAMDLYTIWYHGSVITHIDSLCHYSFENKIYNGFDRSKIADGPGCPNNGVEHQKDGIMTRGILVDLPLHEEGAVSRRGHAGHARRSRGVGAVREREDRQRRCRVPAHRPLGAARAERRRGTSRASAAGWHASVMPWLKQRDVALLGNDAVNDVQPSGVEGNGRPIHQLAIVAMGLPLIDVMDLEAVAQVASRLKRWEFLLTAAPVPMLGGTGFPLNPIATF